jgi:hypothetical protein
MEQKKQSTLIELNLGPLAGTKIWVLNPEGLSDNDFRGYWLLAKAIFHSNGDFPAIETEDGYKVWFRDGKRHRDNDLPAVEYVYNNCIFREWYKDGLRHRDNDLPALEYGDGGCCKEWWVNGIKQRKLVIDNGTKKI